MRVDVANRQTREAVPLAWLKVVARRAVRRLHLNASGTLAVTFIDRRTMMQLNRRFLQHHGLTDVLSFRYPTHPARPGRRAGEAQVAGEILIAPAAARAYAKAHGIAYRHELARYVMHGLLHWLGYNDATPRQQHRMRRMEDQLLEKCAD